MEEELGVGLLDRGARHARPTVQGQLLYDYARRIIQLTQQAQAAIPGYLGAFRPVPGQPVGFGGIAVCFPGIGLGKLVLTTR